MAKVAEIDQRTIAQAQAGDPEAFAAVYQAYRLRITQYCRRLLRSAEEGAEVGREVFLKAWRAVGSTAGQPLQVEPWLYRIATNHCRDVLRRRRLVRWIALDPSAAWQQGWLLAHDDSERAVLLGELAHEVAAVLNRLYPKYRVGLRLREFDELTYRQIAQRLGLSLPAAKSLLYRARQECRERWREGDERGGAQTHHS